MPEGRNTRQNISGFSTNKLDAGNDRHTGRGHKNSYCNIVI
jgi:hypothetical protein